MQDNDNYNLIAAFQEYAATIRDTKRNQWRSIYYLLLVFAGLAGYLRLDAQNNLVNDFVVWIAYAVISLFVVWYVWSAHFSLVRYRGQFYTLRDKIGGEFKEIIKGHRIHEDYEFPVFFTLLIAISNIFLFTFIDGADLERAWFWGLVVFMLAVALAVMAYVRYYRKTKDLKYC